MKLVLATDYAKQNGKSQVTYHVQAYLDRKANKKPERFTKIDSRLYVIVDVYERYHAQEKQAKELYYQTMELFNDDDKLFRKALRQKMSINGARIYDLLAKNAFKNPEVTVEFIKACHEIKAERLKSETSKS